MKKKKIIKKKRRMMQSFYNLISSERKNIVSRDKFYIIYLLFYSLIYI